ncbi:hypothetical protein NDU88_002547 [Pleurodeles waltl]|uniref:Transmembrane protein 106A n=2 Tax=Pleurodeles waltl TaxID=8319 RepID=A0AAV7QA65_PLEWA|nr:hypothetical protein NDU88_002547 [Pleurodeles waltl]
MSVNEEEGDASSPYEIIESHATCFTCQGTGRIPRDQERDLVALIPYSDQRLKPRRTKLYVSVTVVACVLAFSLVIFFLFPRSIELVSGGVNSSSVSISTVQPSVNLETTHIVNVTNQNYYGLSITQLDVEVILVTVVIGKVSIKHITHILPLSRTQIFLTVESTIKDENTFKICTWPKIKVHNLLLHIQMTVTCSLMGHSEQLFFEDYQYVDCRSNSTAPRLIYSQPP